MTLTSEQAAGSLSDVEFVPTGGIHLDNIADYARAGAAAVGVGSALIPKTDWTSAGISSQAQALKAAWNAARTASSRPR